MTKTNSFWMLGTLGLALCAAPLFAQQSDTNAPQSPQSTQSQQQPADPTATTPQTQSPDQTGQGQTAQPPASQTQPGQPPAGTEATAGESQSFSGTVVKAGDKYVLQDASGKTYDIDHQDEVKKFDGKKVRVRGTLDQQTKTIHVQ